MVASDVSDASWNLSVRSQSQSTACGNSLHINPSATVHTDDATCASNTLNKTTGTQLDDSLLSDDKNVHDQVYCLNCMHMQLKDVSPGSPYHLKSKLTSSSNVCKVQSKLRMINLRESDFFFWCT